MTELKFFVAGEPRAKQSFRSTGKGRGYTPARIKAWQADVGWVAQQTMRNAGFDGPVANRGFHVNLDFQLGDNRRIDLDNLSKAVLDGLNGIVWDDDRNVIHLNLRKEIYPEQPGVRVNVMWDSLTNIKSSAPSTRV